MTIKKFGKPGNADGIRCDIDGNIWATGCKDMQHIFAPDMTELSDSSNALRLLVT